MTTAEEIAQQAKGQFKPEYITQTNSVEERIIERLRTGEQLHFLFFNHSKGFRIFEPDGTERTPDHTSLLNTGGTRFLLVTDERVLYIVGGDEETDEKLQEFPYDNIISVEGLESINDQAIKFGTKEGREYKFVNGSYHSADAHDAVPYIESQIDAEVQETTATADTKYCPDCGAELTAQDAFCSDCGNSVEQLETEDSEGTDFTWTLPSTIGLIMTLLAYYFTYEYLFVYNNIISGVLYFLAGNVGGSYFFSDWKISRGLAVALFLLFWMSGSFFIGTGAA
jgi:hypothetical protein